MHGDTPCAGVHLSRSRAGGAITDGVRLALAIVLLAGGAVLTARQALGHAHRLALGLLLVPALLLSWWESEDHSADVAMSHAASALAGRPVHVTCQRLTGTFVDAGAELGYVQWGPDGKPVDETVLKYDTCKHLYDWLGSDKQDPSFDEVVAVHVLAHESEHLAGEHDESVAECYSVQTTAETAELLGATREQARALARRYWREVYPYMPDGYRNDQCKDGGALDLQPDTTDWP
jgi:hypothetical protein